MAGDKAGEVRRREAASWFATLNQTQVTTQDVEAFSVWRRDAENAAAFDRVQGIWSEAGALASDPAIQALTRATIDKRKVAAREPVVSRFWKPAAGLAGVLLAALIVTFWIVRPVVHETDVGERRTVTLADGSAVTLDTGSRIRVRMTGTRRDIDLVAGQAFFDVAGNPARPFTVTANGASVTAIGTRFEVRRLDHGMKVVLVEGAVEVAETEGAGRAWRLSPGETITTAEPMSMVSRTDVDQETSWTTGRLIFDGERLGSAVEEINRYTARKITLRSPDLSNERISGVFDAGDVDGFVAAVTGLYPLRAEDAASGIALVPVSPPISTTPPA